MKDLNLIVWITQLGLSVAVPLAGFVLLAQWLRDRYGWGEWVLWVGIVFGVVMALDGLYRSLKTLAKISGKSKEDGPPPVSFDEHD